MPRVDTTRLYADHPHLAKIDEMWGTRSCREFMSELMNETRGGSRAGFALENASTIMRLLMEHDREYPDLDDSFAGNWYSGGLDRSRNNE